jgi:hypothetical protein
MTSVAGEQSNPAAGNGGRASRATQPWSLNELLARFERLADFAFQLLRLTIRA